MIPESRLYALFANVASALGFSEVHGRVLAALLVHKQLSLDELARHTRYSRAAISLSLDLLELLGFIRRVRQQRKLYVRLEGDLLAGLRTALLFKIQKESAATLAELETQKGIAATRLAKEIRRLQRYADALAKVPLPKK